ncbi:hypothetical protein DOY81_008482 [Sarcophaga bullata]|nr:hypothetical protein DOY81_008482 [Sarcophaga bullata]
MKELDEEEFFRHSRMCCNAFNLLLALIGRELKKPKQRIGPEETLAITLLYSLLPGVTSLENYGPQNCFGNVWDIMAFFVSYLY